ncbi:hypothetical protein [Photobacterium lipolyticum]|uniref:hypothetical protein n=1 Tax=Photobacterium lipolyticum TaxID=266810 RepID=UPI0011B2158F|nr:hypothetical protein [Photobacterium lipolyticum]
MLAWITEEQALIQVPDAPLPQVLSLEEWQAQWSGEVVALQGAALCFDVSWFIPEFVCHRKLIGEVLLFSLMLQLLALATTSSSQLAESRWVTAISRRSVLDPVTTW